MAPRLNDVARVAGVSPTAVSLVLRGEHGSRVSAETARRIQEAARRLNYVPNRMARGLVTRRSGMIGLWVPFHGPLLLNFFLGQLLAGVQHVAQERGFDLVLYSEPQEAGARYGSIPAQRLASSSVIDGLLLVSTRYTTPESLHGNLDRLAELGMPFVVANHWPPVSSRYSCVGIAEDERIRLALNHLVGLGHQRILLLGGDPSSVTAQKAWQAFREQARAQSVDREWYDTAGGRWYLEGGYDESRAYTAVFRKLLAGSQATAILAMSDEMAIGALRALRERGMRVPADMSVMGCDDIILASYVDPPITTLRSPAFQMGVTAAEILLAQLNGDSRPQQVMLHSELVVRASTGPYGQREESPEAPAAP
ncbi:LacI family DNA-binding transcriptional regulator [Limnochorda pilosa]|uniref:HTH lacI-type domain-containing protein n=1 Tax=Limnochorda pilosa TaxID=1555112 RepID=A0A0K2SGT2_LIMPI|nr:LacI family DNA-binding transcriptional regulator [Limnochorda pilosa]BAS26321.1 hypothetical protein LIP_0464 [Limnochorda pilosa]